MAHLIESRIILIGALFVGACGGQETDNHTGIKRSTLTVAADPPGHMFTDNVAVSLQSTGAASIYYTLDGKSPAGEAGIPYDGPIELSESALLTFIAVDGELWSSAVTELYELEDVLPDPQILARALHLNDDALVFSASRGEPGTMRKTVRIQSVGLQRVEIKNIYITFNPESWSFWHEGAFVLETDAVPPMYLLPGESIEMTVAYEPTETIRTGMLVVESDDMRREEGYVLVDLMGRIFDW